MEKEFNRDLDAVLDRCKEAGVVAVINIGYNLPYARRAVALAAAYPLLYASVGIHPHDAAAAPEDYLEELKKLAQKPKVVALGEMGLDFYRNLSPPATQEKIFREQLNLARELALPVVVHDRDAHKQVLKILGEERAAEFGCLLHCFSGDWEMARQCIKKGYYLSLAGPVTYKNAAALKEVAQKCPREFLLLETDSPYLAPHPQRGKRNEPPFVTHICREVANLRGEAYEEVARFTFENTCRFFRLSIGGEPFNTAG